MTRIGRVRDMALRLLAHPYPDTLRDSQGRAKGKPRAYDRLPTPDEPLDCSGFVNLIVVSPLGGGLEFIHKGDASIAGVNWQGSWTQSQWVRQVPVADALEHVGCLLFRRPNAAGIGHVGFSLGRGFTIEAVGGRTRKVTIFRDSENAQGRWHLGGILDQLREEL